MLNANEFFEIVGELYYNRYHRLRPGKSVPSVCGYDSSSEENTMQFKEWVEGPLAFNDAIERIGKLQFVLASDYEVLAASVDRLTSDKARLAAELAAEQESNTFLNNLHTLDADRIKTLEAAIESIHTMRLNWALVCACKCSECDIFFEGIRDVLPETQSETPADYTIDGDGVWMGGKWHPKGAPKSETGTEHLGWCVSSKLGHMCRHEKNDDCRDWLPSSQIDRGSKP